MYKYMIHTWYLYVILQLERDNATWSWLATKATATRSVSLPTSVAWRDGAAFHPSELLLGAQALPGSLPVSPGHWHDTAIEEHK